jgi:hypothetical protein
MYYRSEITVIGHKIDLKILIDLRVLSPPDYENAIFDMPCVCIAYVYIWMCAWLAPKRQNEFYLCSLF